MTVATKREPFTGADLVNINRWLYELNQMNELWDKYEHCGIECSEGKMRAQDLYNQLLLIKQTFFPGKA